MIRIRPLNPGSLREIELVASRMRQTLVDVLGEERGGGMYTIEWLVARATFHVMPTLSAGEVLVAERGDEIVGHSIVRVEQGDKGEAFGLFSTTYVIPAVRRLGAASALLESGEAWMRVRGLPFSRTYTDENNDPLIRLFEKHGYAVIERKHEFAVLEKAL